MTASALRGPVLLLSCLSLLALAGCGGAVIDINKAQAAILAEVEVKTGEQIDTVECPTDVQIIPGSEFTCSVTAADGTEAVANLKILNEDADVDMISLTKP